MNPQFIRGISGVRQYNWNELSSPKGVPALGAWGSIPTCTATDTWSSTPVSGVVLEVAACCTWGLSPRGAAGPFCFLGDGHWRCPPERLPRQGVPTQGRLPVAARSFSSSRSNTFWCFPHCVILPSFKSNMLDGFHITLYNLKGYFLQRNCVSSSLSASGKEHNFAIN